MFGFLKLFICRLFFSLFCRNGLSFQFFNPLSFTGLLRFPLPLPVILFLLLVMLLKLLLSGHGLHNRILKNRNESSAHLVLLLIANEVHLVMSGGCWDVHCEQLEVILAFLLLHLDAHKTNLSVLEMGMMKHRLWVNRGLKCLMRRPPPGIRVDLEAGSQPDSPDGHHCCSQRQESKLRHPLGQANEHARHPKHHPP
jgi:hypothetical protein